MAPLTKQVPRPALTPFVGREALLDQIEIVVRTHRLVTLVGPGGIGKTRLSLELGRRVADSFADGVAFVALDSVREPEDVPWRAAAAIQASDQSTRPATEHVVRHLADKTMVLIVDNCEHVLDAAAELVLAVLDGCPNVHVLATSLGPLGLSHERVRTVPPLEIPDPDADVEEIASSDAVGLLVQRAAQTGARLSVTRENRAEIVELCRHLDGMPLAIELAAVRLRSLSVGDVLARLDERFSLLRGGRDAVGRHQTLTALVDWSFDLCTPDEQRLWRRLSVFMDGCDLAAAEAVCGFGDLDPRFVVDLLDNLVAKSIVQAEPLAGSMRYRMLVTIREYGTRVAQQAGEWDDLHRRHRDLFLQRARDMVRHWPGPRQARSMRAMRTERANIVAALEWSLSLPDEQPRAAELAALLRYQWVTGRYLSDGRYRLERVLAAPNVVGSERGEALWVASWVALIQGDHDAGDAHLAELRALAEALDDPLLRARANHWGALSLLFHGHPAEAAARYEAAIATFRAVGDVADWQIALFQLGLSRLYSGDADAALASQAELIALSEANGETWCKAYALWVRGLALYHQGDLTGARASATAALVIQDDFHDGVCIAHTLLLLSCVAAAAGDHVRTARFQGAADALWCSIGTSIEAFGPGMAGDAAAARAAARRGLGDEEWGRLYHFVTPRDPAELLEWARAEAAALALTAGRAAPRLPGVRLTGRESEVARLLARGLTNKDIAAALTISIRTAEGHVESVLKKLGATSRSQAAAIIVAAQEGDARPPSANQTHPKPPSASSTRR
nr:LuxR family transcriptional regulator [Propionibacterium sp.]